MPSCSHCDLPVGRLGRKRDIHGEGHWFCCYGCCLAWQVRIGSHAEPEAAAWLIRLGVGGFLSMNIMLFSLLLYTDAFSGEDAWLRTPVHWLLWALATPLLVVLGAPFFDGAWQALRRGRLGADSLVSIGVLAAYGYSAWQVLRGSGLVYFDTACMVLLLFTLGRYLEAQGRARAARSLAPMLAAERARVRVVEGGVQTLRPVAEVHSGDIACVLPGERIPLDGMVVEGRSECDESILSGQPDPRPKVAGSTVHAGSLNGSGQLLIRATVDGTQTRWVRIGRLVREALAAKSLVGERVDAIASAFIPAVLLLALATGWFWSTRETLESALLAALAVLVVACPCSLGLAAPLASAMAIGQAAQRGILIRSGAVLERLAGLRGVAFDKTGTLTQDQLHPRALRVDGVTRAQALRRAGSLALGSDHPIALAVQAMARRECGELTAAQATETRAGAGLIGRIDESHCALGSQAFIRSLGWDVPSGLANPTALEEDGTSAFIAWDGRAFARITLAATPVPEAGEVIAALHARGLATQLLSGDGPGAVARIATHLRMHHWQAGLLPEDKVRLLREWQARHGPIAMVGDGLNDGPVLAAASVGIAVGGATDLAKESADVVLPRSGLTSLLWLLDEADRVHRSVRANLLWAFGYNAVALTLAASGQLRPVLAAALMAGSSLLVVARSWYANRARADTEPLQPGALLTPKPTLG